MIQKIYVDVKKQVSLVLILNINTTLDSVHICTINHYYVG